MYSPFFSDNFDNYYDAISFENESNLEENLDIQTINQLNEYFINTNLNNNENNTTNEETNQILNNRKRKKIHDKSKSDNIREKIKNNSFNFMIEFLNDKIRKFFNENQSLIFRKIDYKLKNIKNKEENFLFLNKSLKEILNEKISPKFSKINKNQNKITLKIVYSNSNLSYFLDMKFKDFYKEYYLKKYVINDKKSKTKNFFDLIENEEKKYEKKINFEKNEDDKQKKIDEKNFYINKIKNIAQNFIEYYENENKN